MFRMPEDSQIYLHGLPRADTYSSYKRNHDKDLNGILWFYHFTYPPVSTATIRSLFRASFLVKNSPSSLIFLNWIVGNKCEIKRKTIRNKFLFIYQPREDIIRYSSNGHTSTQTLAQSKHKSCLTRTNRSA